MNLKETEVLELRCTNLPVGFEHGFGTRHLNRDQSGWASLRQIHSDRVLVVDGEGCAGEGDALITRTPGLGLSIRTADCYPILLADPVSGAVAAVHAGWRGTAAGIIPAAIEEMRAHFGTNANDLFVAIGPGIGACCYEVGEEVAREFRLTGRAKIDLERANREQLIESGVDERRIESIGRCTFCEPGTFYSYRREGERAGRMISFIRRLPNS